MGKAEVREFRSIWKIASTKAKNKIQKRRETTISECKKCDELTVVVTGQVLIVGAAVGGEREREDVALG